MQFTAIFTAAALAAVAFAAPAPRQQLMHGETVGTWAVRDLVRDCNDADTECKWSFNIDLENGSALVPCTFYQRGNQAHTIELQQQKCEGSDYLVSEKYNGGGWWDFPVVSPSRNLISYLAYNQDESPNHQVAKVKEFNVERI